MSPIAMSPSASCCQAAVTYLQFSQFGFAFHAMTTPSQQLGSAFRAVTTPSHFRHSHIPELICGVNSSIDDAHL